MLVLCKGLLENGHSFAMGYSVPRRIDKVLDFIKFTIVNITQYQLLSYSQTSLLLLIRESMDVHDFLILSLRNTVKGELKPEISLLHMKELTLIKAKSNVFL